MRDHTQEPFDLNVGVEVEENENAYEASHMLCLGGAQTECVDGGDTEHEIPLQIDLNKAPLDEDETHLIDLNESPIDNEEEQTMEPRTYGYIEDIEDHLNTFITGIRVIRFS